jgi:hypothetical protein
VQFVLAAQCLQAMVGDKLATPHEDVCQVGAASAQRQNAPIGYLGATVKEDVLQI